MAAANRYHSLLLIAALILLIATSALWREAEQPGYFLTMLYAVFFCAGGYALARNRKWLTAYAAMAAAGLVLSAFQDSTVCGVLHIVSVTIAQLMLFGAVIGHCFFKRNIPHVDRIIAGIAGYLLLGLIWTMQFLLLSLLAETHLTNQVTGQVANLADHLYFSFVTLTTLGYGDIVPVSAPAKVLTIFTSLSGVLYLAVFVAALIGSLRRDSHTD